MAGGVWLILPTYNEAENIAAIVPEVHAALSAAAPDGFHILVVDDNSPDGTGAIADELASRFAEVEVLHRRSKGGLGQAYVAAFKHVLSAGADYVIEMDADFSHHPSYLPKLLTEARNGADLVLGSRYVPGGGIENWGVARRVVSRGGCFYARHVLGVGIRDLTGGFKCFRADTLRTIDFESVRSQGYAFQVELTYRTLRRGLQVREVPIVFRERERGKSKMSSRIALEAAWLVPALKWGRTSGR